MAPCTLDDTTGSYDATTGQPVRARRDFSTHDTLFAAGRAVHKSSVRGLRVYGADGVDRTDDAANAYGNSLEYAELGANGGAGLTADYGRSA